MHLAAHKGSAADSLHISSPNNWYLRSECIYTAFVATKPKEKKKNKDAQLVLRLDSEMRDNFVRACKDMDTTAAREIRRYIKRFLKRYEKGELEE